MLCKIRQGCKLCLVAKRVPQLHWYSKAIHGSGNCLIPQARCSKNRPAKASRQCASEFLLPIQTFQHLPTISVSQSQRARKCSLDFYCVLRQWLSHSFAFELAINQVERGESPSGSAAIKALKMRRSDKFHAQLQKGVSWTPGSLAYCFHPLFQYFRLSTPLLSQHVLLHAVASCIILTYIQ